MVMLPVLVSVTLAPKPPDHWLLIAYCTEQAIPLVAVGVGIGVEVAVAVGVEVTVAVGVEVTVAVGVLIGVGVGVELLPARISMPSTLALSLTLVNWIVICPVVSAVVVNGSTTALATAPAVA